MAVIAGLARWLQARAGRGPGVPTLLTADLAGLVRDVVARLDPAVMLVVDLPRPETFGSGSALTVHIGCLESEASAARRLRVVKEGGAGFLLRQDRLALLTPPGPHTAGFFDMAVVGVGVPIETLRLLRGMRRLGHAGSVIVLVGAVGVVRRLAAKIPGETIVARDSQGRAALLIGPENGELPSAEAAEHADTALADFVRRHRRIDPDPATGGIVEDRAAPTSIIPDYRILDPHPDLMTEEPRGYRSLGRWWGRPLQLLPARIEAFADVHCLPGNSQQGIALFDRDGRLLPASYIRRRGYGPDAVAVATAHGPTFLRPEAGGRVPLGWSDRIDCRVIEDAPGLYLGYADRRFGHFLTESLARAWAIPWARQHGLRFYIAQSEPLLDFQIEALRLLGIAAAQVLPLRPRTSYRRLYVPSEGFRVTGSVTPVVAEGWQRVAAAAERERPEGEATPRNLYLSRRNAPRRVLTNEAEVEDLLAARGFAIIAPEGLPFAAQVRLVANADRVAGCFGSQLHLSMFMAPGARKLVIGRERFLGPDETLIAIGNRSEVDYFVEPQGRAGAGRSEDEDWTVDLPRFERALDRWLAA